MADAARPPAPDVAHDAAPIVARVVDAAPAGWNALVRDDENATPAHRAVVASTLAAVLSGLSARFVVVERDGALLGGSPLCLERRLGLTWVHALPFLLPAAPLALAGDRAAVDDAVAGALACLAAEPGIVGGEWSCYRPSGEMAERTLERVPGVTWLQWAGVVDLTPGGEIERGLDRDDRKKLRHARAPGYALHEEPGALEAVYALHLAQSRGWGGHRPMPLELSRRLLCAADADGPAARLFTARDARGIAAGVLALDHPREMLMWWSGTRGGSSASRFLLAAVAEWGAARGRTRFNLGGSSGRSGLAAFKRSLGAREVPLPVRWLAPAPRGAARAMAALQAWARRGRHRGA